MSWTNYHSHSNFCDGSDKPELYIKNAIAKKMPAYGFSSHAPINFETYWCIPDSDLEKYLKEVSDIKRKYASKIQVYIGLEIDYIPNFAGRKQHILENCQLDYFIGSIHFINQFSDGSHWSIDDSRETFTKGLKEIFNNNFKKAAEKFYENTCQMLIEDKPNIIGHFDKIKMYNTDNKYFSENDKWYKKQVDNALKTIKQTGSIIEINTRGYYRYGQTDLYPSVWIIKKMLELNIPMVLNSDSHAPDEITSGFKYAAIELKNIGVNELWVLYDNKWQAKKFNHEGYIW